MPHTRENLRTAKRLGVRLEEAAHVDSAPLRLNSGGRDVLTFGQGRITRFVRYRPSDGKWDVKMGRSPMGTFTTLDEAVGFAKWLGREANRRAARGLAPKAPKGASLRPEAVEGSLAELLQSVNGGAVRVR